MLTGQTIAVTGATGFLGSHITLALLNAGATVAGVVRTPEKGAWMTSEDFAAGGPTQLSFSKADLSDEAGLAQSFEGCDAVVANAALAVKGNATLAAFQAANVRGVEHTFRAAHQAGVRRIVMISTVGVYKVRIGRPMDESTPVRTGFRFDASLFTTNWRYTVTKAQGELRARELADELDLALTILRPGPIYGARDAKFTAQLAQRVQRKWVIVPNVGVPMVHAGEVAQGVSQALSKPVSIGKTYNLGGVSQSFPEVIRTVAGLLNTECRVISVPVGLRVRFDDGAAARDLEVHHRPLVDGLREALYTPGEGASHARNA